MSNRIRFRAGILLLMAFTAFSQQGPRTGFRGGPRAESLPEANSESERRVMTALKEAQAGGALFQNVPAADGRMLRLLTEAVGAKYVVEVGTSTGLSGLWLCLALQKTRGRLTTFEYDAGRAASARALFRKAGVEQLVTVVEGDAHQTLSRVKEPIDVLFIDADKEGYVDYLTQLLPFVRPGGLILAHNIDMVDDYDKRVTSDPALETLFYRDGGGLGITLKKR